MILSTTRVIGNPENRREFFQTIKPLLPPIKSAKGCVTFSFYIDATDENSFLLMSEWETENDFENYCRSNDFAVLRGAINTLGVSSFPLSARVVSRSSTFKP
jgi:quinol monooxygenase YgiN